MGKMDQHSFENSVDAKVRRPAFTLVELLVVIGIIALLISMLLPVLGKAREQANKVKCLANMKQIGLAYLMYAGDNKGSLPCFLIVYSNGGRFSFQARSTWGPSAGDAYQQLSGAVATAVAPTDPTAAVADGQFLIVAKPYGLSSINYLKTTDCFFCPSDSSRRPFRDSTGWGPFEADLLGAAGTSMSYFEYYRPLVAYTATSFAATSDTVNNGSIRVRHPAKKYIMCDQGYIPNPISNPADAANLAQHFPFFHKNGYNVLYVDGHAIWTDTSAIKKYEAAPYKQNFQAASTSAFNEVGG